MKLEISIEVNTANIIPTKTIVSNSNNQLQLFYIGTTNQYFIPTETNELIYIPKTLAKKIMDKYDTQHHENTPNISQTNIEHIYGWASKALNNNWSHVNIIR